MNHNNHDFVHFINSVSNFCRQLQSSESRKYDQNDKNDKDYYISVTTWLLQSWELSAQQREISSGDIEYSFDSLIPRPNDKEFEFLFIHQDGRNRIGKIINFVQKSLLNLFHRNRIVGANEKLNQVYMSYHDAFYINQRKEDLKLKFLNQKNFEQFKKFFPQWKHHYDNSVDIFHKEFIPGRIEYLECHNYEMNFRFRFPVILTTTSNLNDNDRDRDRNCGLTIYDYMMGRISRFLEYWKNQWSKFLSMEDSNKYFSLPVNTSQFSYRPYINNDTTFINEMIEKWETLKLNWTSYFPTTSILANFDYINSGNFKKHYKFWTSHLPKLIGQNGQNNDNNNMPEISIPWIYGDLATINPCDIFQYQYHSILPTLFGHWNIGAQFFGSDDNKTSLSIQRISTNDRVYFGAESMTNLFYKILNNLIYPFELIILIQEYINIHCCNNAIFEKL